MKASIYIMICNSNDRIYVGSTKRKLGDRKQEHLNALDKQNHFNNSMQEDYNKYGKNDFNLIPLEIFEYETKKDILERESYWINFYKDNHGKLYNIDYNINRGKYNITDEIDKHKSLKKDIDIYMDIIARINEGYKNKEIMKEFNVSNSLVSNLRNKKHWLYTKGYITEG